MFIKGVKLTFLYKGSGDSAAKRNATGSELPGPQVFEDATRTYHAIQWAYNPGRIADVIPHPCGYGVEIHYQYSHGEISRIHVQGDFEEFVGEVNKNHK